MTLKTMQQEDFLALKVDARVIESDQHGEKVLRLADGRFLKLFRRRRLITSTAFYPYAQRFADNAVALAGAGGGYSCPTRYRRMAHSIGKIGRGTLLAARRS
ncbi:MAG: hypothetical protein FWG81_03740 [Betaproteobacteria bacterium]|nr:hypothetical protein [Betaproteobacteria bacterium]